MVNKSLTSLIFASSLIAQPSNAAINPDFSKEYLNPTIVCTLNYCSWDIDNDYRVDVITNPSSGSIIAYDKSKEQEILKRDDMKYIPEKSFTLKQDDLDELTREFHYFLFVCDCLERK